MRFGLVFSVAGLAACSDTSIKTVNSGPEAIIASHSTGEMVREGDTECWGANDYGQSTPP